jgi:solute carrier family 25 aspartate/glutamate transporter 12/13
MAFNSLLNQMELMKKIYLQATENNRNKPVTKEEFLHSAQMMSQVTPLEVDILYRIVDMTEDRTGKVTYASLQKIAPEQYFKQVQRRIADVQLVHSVEERGVFVQILESTYRFTLGAFAGGKDKSTELSIKVSYFPPTLTQGHGRIQMLLMLKLAGNRKP